MGRIKVICWAKLDNDCCYWGKLEGLAGHKDTGGCNNIVVTIYTMGKVGYNTGTLQN